MYLYVTDALTEVVFSKKKIKTKKHRKSINKLASDKPT